MPTDKTPVLDPDRTPVRGPPREALPVDPNLPSRAQRLVFIQTPVSDAITPETNEKILAELARNGVRARPSSLPRENMFDERNGFRYIGHGGMGVAYGVGPQKVLKVTTDDKEARSSMTVMDLSPESDVFPKFYDVFGFQSVGDQTLYGILQEQLEKPAQKWETFGKLWLEWRKRAMSLVYDENLKVRKGVSYDEAVQHKKAYEADLNFDNIVEFARWLAAREGVGVRDIRSKYAEELEWLMHASEELARADIRYWDFKAQNLMARKGKPVLIDLGVSDSPTPLKSVRVLGEVLDDLAERISMPRKIRTL